MNSFEALSQALDSGAVVRSRPDLGTLVVTGEERLSWLGGMLTNDISKLGPNQAAYALSVNRNGKVQADVWVLALDDRLLLAVSKDQCDALVEALDNYLIMEDAEVARLDAPVQWWIAHGPQAEGVVAAARAVGGRAGLCDYATWPTAVVAVEGTVHPNLGEELTKPEGAILATPGGWDRLRVAHRLAAFGIDYGTDAYPQEARLEDYAVSFNKGCYLGQEAVFMLEKRGKPPKRLVRLALEAAVEPSTPITVDGTTVGKVTTVATLPDGPQALGVVKTKYSDEGAVLQCGATPARVL